MFTDEHRRSVWDRIRQHGIRSFEGKLTRALFVEAANNAGAALGGGPLWLGNLVWLGIASAIHTGRDFAGVLKLTWQLLSDTEGFAQTDLAKQIRNAKSRQGRGREKKHKPTSKSKNRRKTKRSKHDPRRAPVTQVSEEAFVQARQRMPIAFWLALIGLLTERVAKEQSQWVCWKGFRLLAMDGTTIDLPKRSALKSYYGTAKNGLGTSSVQARMVMLQMPLARLPYRYELVPLKVGECTVAERLATFLQADDLVLLDRGFWSYGLFWQIQQRRAYFGVRLSKNPKLRTLRRLGPGDRLVTWKPAATGIRRCRKKGYDVPEAICLRVVDYRIKGFRPSAVVTNLLDAKRIPSADWVRLTTETEPGDQRLGVGLYHRRWEIETSFRELKVTQGMEGSLRSHTPPGIEYEIAGHVVLYLLVRWLMAEAATRHGQDPLRLSFSAALHTLEDMRVQLITSSEFHVRHVLLPRLFQRMAMTVVPERHGRHYARLHDAKPKHKGKGRKQLPAKLAA
jgi:DDE family transposase